MLHLKRETKRETNVEFVTRIMESGSPLRQAFVMIAIQKYAERCAAQPGSAFESALLSGEAWVSVAKEIDAECKKKMA